jgi:hypothetical protein
VANTEAKYDVKKEFPGLYAPRVKGIHRVLVPELLFICVDGEGSPDGPGFQSGMQALYSLAYALKFRSKTLLDRDFVVGPAEGLWSADDPLAFVTGDTGSWRWTLLSALPPWITQQDFDVALEVAKKKASSSPANAVPVLTSLARAQLLPIAEGLCLQVLHVGPYEAEAEVLTVMHNDVMPRDGLTFNGPHHEIYLSNPGRTSPEKLKTILRQPVRPA